MEKEMKTKAFSKEGLTAAAKLDPHEKEKQEMREFLEEMNEGLSRQVEALEAEIDHLQAHTKKKSSKAERVSALEETNERHKYHMNKLETLMRALDNDGVDVDQVRDIQDSIRDYVENNQEVDFMEDEYMYEDLNLDDEEERYGVGADAAKSMSNEDISAASPPETLERTISQEQPKNKTKPATVDTTTVAAAATAAAGRRPSQQIKSPLPALADMSKAHAMPAPPPASNMRPAPPPSNPSGGVLKYASAAAAAAATDKAGIGIAPLPPPPGIAKEHPGVASAKASAANSPAVQSVALSTGTTESSKAAPPPSKSPEPSATSASMPSPAISSAQAIETAVKAEGASSQNGLPADAGARAKDGQELERSGTMDAAHVNGASEESDEAEPIYHLPANLQELLESYESTRAAAMPPSHEIHQRQLTISMNQRPDSLDAEKPRHYKPSNPSYYTPPHYPQTPLAIFDDARLYSKIDTDSLFYSFYYRQGTYQQYLAAKALKAQSWRFHKQYQTWFQRHEEPKHITEDFEQGTYRFFDYESTW